MADVLTKEPKRWEELTEEEKEARPREVQPGDPQLDRVFVDHMMVLIKDDSGSLDDVREEAFLAVLSQISPGFRAKLDHYLYGVHQGQKAAVPPRRRNGRRREGQS